MAVMGIFLGHCFFPRLKKLARIICLDAKVTDRTVSVSKPLMGWKADFRNEMANLQTSGKSKENSCKTLRNETFSFPGGGSLFFYFCTLKD